MVEARREFTWQITHRQTLDLINSQRARKDQIKNLGYPYCNSEQPIRQATHAETVAWLGEIAGLFNMTITRTGENNG